MKKFWIFTLFVSAMTLFVSCGGSGKETPENNETDNTGISDTDTPADTGSVDDDNGISDTDASADTGTVDDSGMPDADTPDDTDTADDTGIPDSDTPDEDTDIQSECTGISLDIQHLIPSPEHTNIWYAGYDPRFFMQFYFENGYGRMPGTGTYDLGSVLNTNYRTCTECVSIYKDVVDENYTTFFFQERGTLEVESYDESTKGLQGTLTAKLIEVELDDNSNSTPVPDGSCIEIEAAAFSSEGCVPQCENKDCGDDGCGGTCGTCGHDQGCSSESKCVALDFSGCTGLSVDWGNMVQYGIDKFYAVKDGGSDPRATIQFAQDINTGKITAGEYNLGSEINSHYKTCTECVLIYSDLFINASGYNEYAKKYFQHDGILKVSNVDEENRITGTLTARVFEATMDKKLMTNFVAGGKCFEIETVAFDTKK